MQVEIKLTGFAELAAALKQLPDNIARSGLRSAVAAGAATVRVQAKANALAMKDTGTLARSIYQKQIRELSSLQRQVFYVGARQGKRYQKRGKKGLSSDAYYARFVELGHFTRPSTGGRVLRKSNRGEFNADALEFQVRHGMVKWVSAQPFLRPAFQVKKDAAIEAMAVKLRERIQRYRVAGK